MWVVYENIRSLNDVCRRGPYGQRPYDAPFHNYNRSAKARPSNPNPGYCRRSADCCPADRTGVLDSSCHRDRNVSATYPLIINKQTSINLTGYERTDSTRMSQLTNLLVSKTVGSNSAFFQRLSNSASSHSFRG